MPKYRVTYPVFASVDVDVEAHTEDQAMEIADARATASLCHQCAGEIELGDIDYENGRAELITEEE